MMILITGASGSGTTTLGRAVAEELRCSFLDADDYYWLPTEPPFRERREPGERLLLIMNELKAARQAVVAGSVMGWGTELEECFDLIVFLYLDAALRVERLRRREEKLLGAADPEFLAWAAAYDSGPGYGRSLAKHEAWLGARTCPVLRLHGNLTVDDRCRRVMGALDVLRDVTPTPPISPDRAERETG